MAFLSRLFGKGAGDPLAERAEAHRQGMRDAREHPLGEFTDPEFQPAYVTEIRARAREQIAGVDRVLAATRTSLLDRAVGARETILRELGRADLRPPPGPASSNGHLPNAPLPNGQDAPPQVSASPRNATSPLADATGIPHLARPYLRISEDAHVAPRTRGSWWEKAVPQVSPDSDSSPYVDISSQSSTSSQANSARQPTAPPWKGAFKRDDSSPENGAGAVRDGDEFISIGESRARRAEARRQAVLEEAGDTVHRARAQIERLTQEWESALIERNHEVEAVHARAEQLIAAYKGGVLRVHPRKEEIPSLWKGEVIAMDSTGESAAAVSVREEIGRILLEVETRIEAWHAEVMPRALPGGPDRELAPGPTEDEHPADGAGA